MQPWARTRPETLNRPTTQWLTPVTALMAVTSAMLVATLFLRGIRAEPPPRPEDGPATETVFAEPMQVLAAGGGLRIRELAELLEGEPRQSWTRAARAVFALDSCPNAIEWLQSADGQDTERVIGELRRGDSAQALASLALIVQMTRRVKWSGRIHYAERLAGLLQEWLRLWAEPSTTDALLHEPAQAAFLVYGRLMRSAYDMPTFGYSKAPYERARAFVDELTGARQSRRTAFGESLGGAYPRAFEQISSSKDFLRGCNEEARLLYPELDGKCGK